VRYGAQLQMQRSLVARDILRQFDRQYAVRVDLPQPLRDLIDHARGAGCCASQPCACAQRNDPAASTQPSRINNHARAGDVVSRRSRAKMRSSHAMSS
jgi:hypothetical protein